MIYSGFSAHQCSRNATVDGYCKQHHPDTVKARRAASSARADAKYQNSPIRRLMNRNAELKELLAEALPFVELNICYASTIGEHEPNRIVRDIKEAIK